MIQMFSNGAKKAKLILIIFFLIVGAAVVFSAYRVAKKRYFEAKPETGETQNQAADQNEAPENTGQGETPSASNTSLPESARLNIENKDCDNNCEKFKDSDGNFQYCREVCGQTRITPKNSAEDCANLSGIQKDVCLRDLAVTKKDPVFCKEISDSKLREVCKNRVAEEIFN